MFWMFYNQLLLRLQLKKKLEKKIFRVKVNTVCRFR